MNEVERAFPKSTGAELYAMLQTLQSLPEAARPGISAHLKSKIEESLAALGRIKDNPGNVEAYFHIGTLFLWDFQRIHCAGTMQERMQSVSITFQTPDKGSIQGLHEIVRYFFERYLQFGGCDPNALLVVRSILSSFDKARAQGA